MFVVKKCSSIYMLEQAGWPHRCGPCSWLTTIITVLKFLIIFIRSLHFHFALFGHTNYIAIPENRGWQIFPAKRKMVNTLGFEG